MSNHVQTVIFLVRHGETDKLYSGNDPAVDAERLLTERGKQQSAANGQYLAQFQPVAIYSSPLKRCLETAEVIREQIGLKSDVLPDEGLIEVYAKDSRDEIGRRGEAVLNRFLTEHPGQQIVAVTHQFVIGYIVGDFLGQVYNQVPCELADIYRLVFADNTLVEATHLTPAAKI